MCHPVPRSQSARRSILKDINLYLPYISYASHDRAQTITKTRESRPLLYHVVATKALDIHVHGRVFARPQPCQHPEPGLDGPHGDHVAAQDPHGIRHDDLVGPGLGASCEAELEPLVGLRVAWSSAVAPPQPRQWSEVVECALDVSHEPPSGAASPAE